MCLVTYSLHTCGHTAKEFEVEPCEFADQTGHICGSDGGFQTKKDKPAYGECRACLEKQLPKKEGRKRPGNKAA